MASPDNTKLPQFYLLYLYMSIESGGVEVVVGRKMHMGVPSFYFSW